MPKKEQVLFYPLPHVLYSQNWADPSEICSLRHGIILTRGEANPDPFPRMWQSFRPSAAAARRQQSGTTTSSSAQQTPCRAVSKEQWMPQAASSPKQPEISWVGTDRLDPLPFPQPHTSEARQEIFGRRKQALHPTPSQAPKGCFPLHETANSHLIFHPTRLPGNKKITRKQV